MAQFDELVEMARNRAPLEEVRRRVPDVQDAYVPDDPELWGFLVAIFDYDPAPALERIQVPVLALFGEGDEIVPVADSVGVYRAAVRHELLTVVVFPGADHRVQTGEPPHMANGYLETLCRSSGRQRLVCPADGQTRLRTAADDVDAAGDRRHTDAVA